MAGHVAHGKGERGGPERLHERRVLRVERAEFRDDAGIGLPGRSGELAGLGGRDRIGVGLLRLRARLREMAQRASGEGGEDGGAGRLDQPLEQAGTLLKVGVLEQLAMDDSKPPAPPSRTCAIPLLRSSGGACEATCEKSSWADCWAWGSPPESDWLAYCERMSINPTEISDWSWNATERQRAIPKWQ